MFTPCTLRLGHPEPGAFNGSLPLEGIPPPTHPAPPNQVIEWSEEEVVYLHWRLLQDVAQLADAAAPLAEKFDTLRWVFTEPYHDALPFSFASCLRVVGANPLSPIGYCGTVDVEEVRDCLRHQLRRWLDVSLNAYPAWVRQMVREQPAWVGAHLDKNPQWLNEQLKVMAQQGDLFG